MEDEWGSRGHRMDRSWAHDLVRVREDKQRFHSWIGNNRSGGCFNNISNSSEKWERKEGKKMMQETWRRRMVWRRNLGWGETIDRNVGSRNGDGKRVENGKWSHRQVSPALWLLSFPELFLLFLVWSNIYRHSFSFPLLSSLSPSRSLPRNPSLLFEPLPLFFIVFSTWIDRNISPFSFTLKHCQLVQVSHQIELYPSLLSFHPSTPPSDRSRFAILILFPLYFSFIGISEKPDIPFAHLLILFTLCCILLLDSLTKPVIRFLPFVGLITPLFVSFHFCYTNDRHGKEKRKTHSMTSTHSIWYLTRAGLNGSGEESEWGNPLPSSEQNLNEKGREREMFDGSEWNRKELYACYGSNGITSHLSLPPLFYATSKLHLFRSAVIVVTSALLLPLSSAAIEKRAKRDGRKNLKKQKAECFELLLFASILLISPLLLFLILIFLFFSHLNSCILLPLEMRVNAFFLHRQAFHDDFF